VLIRFAFGDLHIAQRFDLGFPLRLALGFKRRDVARLIGKDDDKLAIKNIVAAA
jgi:hypothetical protein